MASLNRLLALVLLTVALISVSDAHESHSQRVEYSCGFDEYELAHPAVSISADREELIADSDPRLRRLSAPVGFKIKADYSPMTSADLEIPLVQEI
jgi:hypothetical protein